MTIHMHAHTHTVTLVFNNTTYTLVYNFEFHSLVTITIYYVCVCVCWVQNRRLLLYTCAWNWNNERSFSAHARKDARRVCPSLAYNIIYTIHILCVWDARTSSNIHIVFCISYVYTKDGQTFIMDGKK